MVESATVNKKKIKAARFVPMLIFIFALIVLLWSWSFYAGLYKNDPEDSDWSKAVDKIEAAFKDGDLVVVVPWWADLGEKHLVEADLPYRYLQKVERENFDGYKRLWIISAFRRFDESDAEERGYKPVKQDAAGPLDIHLYENPEWHKLAYDFREKLPQARVFMRVKGRDHPCPPYDAHKRMHWCGPRDWHWIGQMTIERDMATRDVMWAHPRAGAEFHIAYDNVPLTSGIIVQHGLTEYAVRTKDGSPIQIKVYVDGVLAGELVQENVNGWFIDEVKPKELLGEKHEVEFVITCENEGRRHFHFTAHAI